MSAEKAKKKRKNANSLTDMEARVLAEARAVTLCSAPKLVGLLKSVMPRVSPRDSAVPTGGPRDPRLVSRATVYRACKRLPPGALERCEPGTIAVHAVPITLKINQELDGRVSKGDNEVTKHGSVLIMMERHTRFVMLKRLSNLDAGTVGELIRAFSERILIGVDKVSFVSRKSKASKSRKGKSSESRKDKANESRKASEPQRVDALFGKEHGELKATMERLDPPGRPVKSNAEGRSLEWEITLDEPIQGAASEVPLSIGRSFSGYREFGGELARLVNLYNLGVGTRYAQPFADLKEIIAKQRPDLAGSTTFGSYIKRRLRQ